MDMRELTGLEVNRLTDALTGAFPSIGDLRRLVRVKLNHSLDEMTEGSVGSRCFDLVEFAGSQGLVTQLVEGALEMNAGTLKLRQFHKEYISSLRAAIANVALPAASQSSPVVTRERQTHR